MKATWSVVVLYEDTQSREAALKFCDRLVERFWANYGFEVTWYPFALLQGKESFQEAAHKAATAEVIIFAARVESDLPTEVRAWFEGWLQQRGEREGTLVDLIEPGIETGGRTQTSHKHIYLRDLAHRAGMDYLTQVPPAFSHSIPESLESYSERAHCVTSVLDEILHQRTPPPPPRLRT